MKHKNLTLAPNGRGSTVYLPRDLLEDSGCPLHQGEDVRAELHVGVGILIVPRARGGFEVVTDE